MPKYLVSVSFVIVRYTLGACQAHDHAGPTSNVFACTEQCLPSIVFRQGRVDGIVQAEPQQAGASQQAEGAGGCVMAP